MPNKNLEESEERFRSIIENASDIITLADSEGTIVYNSPSFARQLGYEPWEALGQVFADFVHEDDRTSFQNAFQHLTKAGNGGVAGTPLEFRFRHKDGRWRVFETVVSNLLENESVQSVVLNSRDVTEQKASEAALEKYHQKLEEEVEARTRELKRALEKEKAALDQQMTFVSMVSHEFKTPLTIIDGNAQIILRRGSTLAPEVLQKRAGTIRSSVDRLLSLIETVLSAHIMESGKLSVTLAPCDLIKIIRDVCIERLGVSPNHTIKVDVQKGLPKMMLDEKVMHQVMVNLVSNAIKYAPNNPVIEVRAYREEDTVAIEVTDHGRGIPESELPKIFTRYFRASTSGGIPGSGLGLSLVKQFVELHGGTIGLQSEVDMGTTVTIKLPVRTE